MVCADAGVSGVLTLRGTRLVWGERTYIMGIVNVTPDSFSGDGVEHADAATAWAVEQHAAGATIVDIGGESTRPGHLRVEAAAEMARILPVVAAARERLPGVPISVDSYKPDVIRAAQAVGADIVNSVWGAGDELLDCVAGWRCRSWRCIIRPERSTKVRSSTPCCAFVDCASRALAAASAPRRSCSIPGSASAKRRIRNHRAARARPARRARIPDDGRNVAKVYDRQAHGREPALRVYGTAATTALAVRAGIDVVSVHDVAAARDAVAVADAIVRGWRPAD